MNSDEVKNFTVEGLAASKEELLEKLKSYTPELAFIHEGKHIQVLFEDGCRVPIGQIFYRFQSNFVIGEVLYCHARIQNLEDPEAEPYETIIPILVIAFYKDGVLTERVLKPYMMLRKVELSDRPVLIETRTRYVGTLETLMSLDTAQKFVEGVESPLWNEVYNEVSLNLAKFVNLDWDPRLKDVIVCWIIATYFQEIFNVLPFLYPYGSTGTGKTRLLKTAVYMARHGFLVTDPTEAVLFRMAEALKPTLGIDESLLGSTAWKLIRTAFKKGLYVPRMEKTTKDEFILGLFETFMPVAFSSTEMPKELGGLDADEARAIFVFMQKMPDPIGRDPEPWEFRNIRDKLYMLRLGKADEVLNATQQVESLNLPFSGHEREIWLPLLTIAKIIGEPVYANVLSYALDLYNIKIMRENVQEKILARSILLMFRNMYRENLALNPNLHINHAEFKSSELQPFIKEVLEEWGEYEETVFTKLWDSRKIGRVLTRMGIFKRLKDGRSIYLITVEKLQLLYKQFFPSGLSGLSGLKTRSIIQKNNPLNILGKSETPSPSTTQTSLSSPNSTLEREPERSGLFLRGTDSFFNPLNPLNPLPGKTIIRLVRINGRLFPTEKCRKCGVVGVDWQINYSNGTWELLCFECGLKIAKQIEGGEEGDG